MKLKKEIKNIFVLILTILANNKFSLKLINFLFENLGSRFRSFFIRNVSIKPKQFIWYTKLLNHRCIRIPVDNDYKHWQFCYNYRWHNIGLSLAEQILNDYYDVKYHYLDVGANFGLRTLYAMSINRPLICFEPNTDLHSFTKSVFKANNFKKYTIESYCLSNKTEDTFFYISGSSYMSSLNKQEAESDEYGGVQKKIKVKTITLDNFITDNRKIIPKIIKIDAEGHDFEVLLGAIETIKKYKPSIIIEVNTLEIKQKTIDLLEPLGYNYYGILPQKDFLRKGIHSGSDLRECYDFVFAYDKGLKNKLELCSQLRY